MISSMLCINIVNIMELELQSKDEDVFQTSESQDKEELVIPKERRVSLNTALRLRKWTIIVSWISVTINIILAIGSYVIGGLQQSQALIAFGFESLLDCLSSAVVIWRFQLATNGQLYSDQKERKACLILAILFLCSAVTEFGISLHALIVEYKPFKDDILWYISSGNAAICLVMAILKFYLGRNLQSPSVITDGFNSLLGAILASAILVSSLVFNHVNPYVWYLDGIIGIVCAFVFAIYGMKLLFDHLSLKKPHEKLEKREKETFVKDREEKAGYGSS